MTNLEAYKQALCAIGAAAKELDQAWASLKDCRLTDVDAGGYRKPTIQDLTNGAFALLDALKQADCDECGHAVISHDGPHGCQHGDRDDADGNATRPCSCTWGQKAARAICAPPALSFQRLTLAEKLVASIAIAGYRRDERMAPGATWGAA